LTRSPPYNPFSPLDWANNLHPILNDGPSPSLRLLLDSQSSTRSLDFPPPPPPIFPFLGCCIKTLLVNDVLRRRLFFQETTTFPLIGGFFFLWTPQVFFLLFGNSAFGHPLYGVRRPPSRREFFLDECSCGPLSDFFFPVCSQHQAYVFPFSVPTAASLPFSWFIPFLDCMTGNTSPLRLLLRPISFDSSLFRFPRFFSASVIFC